MSHVIVMYAYKVSKTPTSHVYISTSTKKGVSYLLFHT